MSNNRNGEGPESLNTQNKPGKEKRKSGSREPQPNILLAKAIEAKGWSHGRLAEEIGKCSDQMWKKNYAPDVRTVGRWVRGETYPNALNRELLRLVFGVETTYELGLVPPKGQEDRIEKDSAEMQALGITHLVPFREDITWKEPPLESSPSPLQERGSSGSLPVDATTVPLHSVYPEERKYAFHRLTRRQMLGIGGGVGLISITLGGAFIFVHISQQTPPFSNVRQWPNIVPGNEHPLDTVFIIQWMLMNREDLVLTPPNPNGLFGPKTQDAVKKFRTEKGLSSGDIVDKMAWELLIQPSKYGSHGFHVTALQEQLSKQGFLDDQPDADFGPRTLQAVQAFRQQYHLPKKGDQEVVADLDCWYQLVLLAVHA